MLSENRKFVFKNNSILHMAVCDINTKLVNILLLHMAKIKNKGTRNFSELFGYLVEYQNFINFLDLLPIQTHRMQMKQILRIKLTMTDQIVSMADSTTIYVDNNFYRGGLGEI